ncbi:DUF4238 domain-containing protein [Pelomonas baiyunensis]|uniref:DUF4238 domain-containing protein n=1 Tax=Pelomonas baiyunensis TaxID=3299026 RepID=A0ABW7H0R5_9BURK
MGHHYLPQKYLNGFVREKRIWVHDRLDRRSFPSQPKSVANETDMYGSEVEAFLATQVEDPALEVLDAVRARKQFGAGERSALARYVVALWRRVPRAREFVRQLMPSQAEATRAEVHAALDNLLQTNPAQADLIARKHQEADQIVDRMGSTGGVEIWQKMLTTHQSTNVERALLNMSWSFLISEEVPYITGDNPVFFFEREGIGRPDSELTVPLSSSVALWAFNGRSKYPLYVAARPYAAREVNRRTIAKATRYVFDRDNAPWILPALMKPSHQHHRLR